MVIVVEEIVMLLLLMVVVVRNLQVFEDEGYGFALHPTKHHLVVARKKQEEAFQSRLSSRCDTQFSRCDIKFSRCDTQFSRCDTPFSRCDMILILNDNSLFFQGTHHRTIKKHSSLKHHDRSTHYQSMSDTFNNTSDTMIGSKPCNQS